MNVSREQVQSYARSSVAVYMQQVYLWMTCALGVTAIIFWHMFINIGMVASVVPVVGVTLPFMSYGGSSMLTNMVGMGLIINVAMRRHLF